MKKRINLLNLSKNELDLVKGSAEQTACEISNMYGTYCYCGCYYAGEPGGSSTEDNDAANDEHGYISPPRPD